MEASQVDQQHLEASKHKSTQLETSDSGRTVEIESINEKHIIPAAVAQPRFAGSIRSQFAALLTSHFLACTNPETAAALPRRTSNAPRFRGVTKHKRTQRYEAHIWECKKQIYLGGFDSDILAAKSHDIMAIKCKGAECEILNYEVSDYEEMLPLIERLFREDIISALRNYSKAQTALRLGPTNAAPTNSSARIQPFPMPSLPAIRAGGVQKPGGVSMKRGGSTPRRSPVTTALPLLQQHRRQRRRRHTTLDVSLSEEEDEDDADIDSEATEDVDMDVSDGTESDGDYLYPRHRYYETAIGGKGGGKGGGNNNSMLPPMPHSAPPISRSRCRRSGQCPGAKLSPRIAGSAAGAFRRGSSSTRHHGASPFAWSAPSSPHTPHIRVNNGVAGSTSGVNIRANIAADVAEYDDLDLNFILSSLVDEPSLTYSANDESYLFESMPVDANHTALVHLGGVELFQNSSSGGDQPDSPLSGDGIASVPPVPASAHGGNGHIVTSGINNLGGFLPGTPLPTTSLAGYPAAAAAGAGANGSPQIAVTPGLVHQHSQVQFTPSMYHRSLPLTSPFAAAF